MLYALIKDGIVSNRVVFDGEMPDGWAAEGETWVASEEVQIGWSHDGKTFTAPPRGPDPEPEPIPVDPRDVKIADLEAAVSALKKSGTLTDAMIDAEREVSIKAR